MSATETLEFADGLFDAFERARPLRPLTAMRPSLSIADAYAIQRALILLHERAGRRRVGHKVGLTSAPMRRQLKVDRPDFGVLLDAFVFASGTTFSCATAGMIAPRLEAELGFVLKRPLRGPHVSRADVLAATEAIVPVFEVIDSRIADWQIRIADTIADNASCWGVVRGTPVPSQHAGDLASVTVRVGRDGAELLRGRGEEVMGHPAEAVAWLARELDGFGEGLATGELVLSGSFTAAVDAKPGTYAATFSEPLGVVEVSIAP